MKYFKTFENFTAFDIETMQKFIDNFNTENIEDKVIEHLKDARDTKEGLFAYYNNILKMVSDDFKSASEDQQDVIILYCSTLKKVLEVLSKL